MTKPDKSADRFKHRTRLEKIGAKPEWRTAVVAVGDREFVAELRRAVAEVAIGRVPDERDAIFFGVVDAKELARLPILRRSLKQNGALWVIRPKGRPEISEQAVMDAGKAAGLVDVKVISFSPTHTGEKFVIPVVNRR